MQPLEQGCVLLQLPLQAAKPLASVRNWRAETVPTQRTAVTIVASNVDLITFLLMIHSPLRDKASSVIPPAGLTCCYFPEGATPPGRTVQNAVNGVVKEQKQPAVQGWVELQLPPQAKPFGSFRNWRAETVPAQTTAMTMVANKVDLTIFLPMIALLSN
jgi:hypothetical protein